MISNGPNQAPGRPFSNRSFRCFVAKRIVMRVCRVLGVCALMSGALVFGCGTTLIDAGRGGGGSAVTSGSSEGQASSSGAGGGRLTSNSSTSKSSGSSSSAKACGGIAGATCAANEFCDYPTNRCGSTDMSGICTPRPQACPATDQPVCACDGKVYGNECTANVAGVDTTPNSNCVPPTGKFACGETFCSLATEYCTIVNADPSLSPSTPGASASADCHPLPAACGTTPSCGCLAQVSCTGFRVPQCAGGQATGLAVTCIVY